MRITALQAQVHNPERVNIFVDHTFLLGVHALLVLQMGLKVGQELTEAQIERLRQEEALQQMLDRAMNYLSLRPRSTREVKNYLRRKNAPPEMIEGIVQRLHDFNLLNDQQFASFWVENREHFSPRGSYALKNELQQKGVQREIIDTLVDGEQDEERALRAAEKKALSLLRQPGIDYPTFQRRLGSFLQRRGFNYEITMRTVKHFWEAEKQESIDEPFE
uniref:Regulatory protein RecX n=1 Tax=Thermosporothrix sp. COM3 TaxID=2490863 RepID=A0A455SX68_9CHLR|nr:regulatory protein RecX [Thermosporothrix sp. COM3]